MFNNQGFQNRGFQQPNNQGFQQPNNQGFQNQGFQQPNNQGFQQPNNQGFQQPNNQRVNQVIQNLQLPSDPSEKTINKLRNQLQFKIGIDGSNTIPQRDQLKFNFNKTRSVRFKEHRQKEVKKKRIKVVLRRRKKVNNMRYLEEENIDKYTNNGKKENSIQTNTALQNLFRLFSNLNAKSTDQCIDAIYQNIRVVKTNEQLKNFSTRFGNILHFFKTCKNIDTTTKCSFIIYTLIRNDPMTCLNYINKEFLGWVILNLPNANDEIRSNLFVTFDYIQYYSPKFKYMIFTHPKLLEYISKSIFACKMSLLFIRATRLLISYFNCRNPQNKFQSILMINDKNKDDVVKLIEYIFKSCINIKNIDLLFDFISSVTRSYPIIYEEKLHKIVKTTLFEDLKKNLKSTKVLEFILNIVRTDFINKGVLKDFLYFFDTIHTLLTKTPIFIRCMEKVEKVAEFISHLTYCATIASDIYYNHKYILHALIDNYDFFSGIAKCCVNNILLNVLAYIDTSTVFNYLKEDLWNKNGKEWICLIYDQLKNIDEYLDVGEIDNTEITNTKEKLLGFLNELFEHKKFYLCLFFTQKRLEHPGFMGVILKYLEDDNKVIREITKSIIRNVVQFLWTYCNDKNATNVEYFKKVFFEWNSYRIKCNV
jgi:hypothetical protein